MKIKKLMATALACVMTLELGVVNDVKVHADPVKVAPAMKIVATQPAHGNKPIYNGYFSVEGIEEGDKTFDGAYYVDDKETKWYTYKGNSNVDTTSITGWNVSDWREMTETETFIKGKIYASYVRVESNAGFEVPSEDEYYCTNKFGRILDITFWNDYEAVGMTTVYKCGSAVTGIYLNVAKEPVVGKTAGELSKFYFDSDPAGAFKKDILDTLTDSSLGTDSDDSIWEVSEDGKEYRTMLCGEKFEYGKYYRYNPLFFFMAVLIPTAFFDDVADENVVTNFSENVVLYVNNVPLDKDSEDYLVMDFGQLKGTISKVEMKVKEPVAGEKPDYSLEFVGEDKDKLEGLLLPGWTRSVEWYAYNETTKKYDTKMKETDTFEEGKQYQVITSYTGKKGCEIKSGAKYFINGEEVKYDATVAMFGVARVFTAKKKEAPKTEVKKDEVKVPEVGAVISDGKCSYKVITKASANTPGEVEISEIKNKNAKSVVISDTVAIDGLTYKVTSIKAKAFMNNKKLKKVVIGKNVKKIGAKAFFGCTSLKSVNIKSKILKKVGKKAFYRKKGKKITFTVPKKKKKAYKKLLKGAKTNKYKVK
ncbi:Leucine rich repeat-containing protein [Eubacterium uniforme]|uniref:Leucine rich repeat-containing protein n=1 Tax=Eubacterium uniforme TaxID=39495 RepID=A0A1T4VKJ2_9FIRM|nr:leucine-rich repeat domain-containing protein [Eubacterium uniforme]SKA65459.1 Leucine rich repeat-containing protein [Eubacterium uniforme]